MNVVILMGRLVADPEVRTTQSGMTVARYRLAVDRFGKDKGADFINCVAFDKRAEFAEKYLSKGMKICVNGRLQTGSYDHKDGYKVYTTDIIVNEHFFCDSKADNDQARNSKPASEKGARTDSDGFMSMDDIDEDLPFM